MRAAYLSLIFFAAIACSDPTGAVPIGSSGPEDVNPPSAARTITGLVALTDLDEDGVDELALDIGNESCVRLLGATGGLDQLVGHRIAARGVFMSSGAFMVADYEVAG